MVTGEAGATLFAYLLQLFLPVGVGCLQATKLWNFGFHEGVVVLASVVFINVSLLLREDYCFGLAMRLVFLGVNFVELGHIYGTIVVKSMSALLCKVRTEAFLFDCHVAAKAPTLLIFERRYIIHKSLTLLFIWIVKGRLNLSMSCC